MNVPLKVLAQNGKVHEMPVPTVYVPLKVHEMPVPTVYVPLKVLAHTDILGRNQF